MSKGKNNSGKKVKSLFYKYSFSLQDSMSFYKEEHTKRIFENYQYLLTNEYFIDKAIELYEQKKMDEFNEHYLEIKDIIPLFLLTLKDTENKIKLIHSSKLKVDEKELKIFSDYLKDINKKKVKKINTIQKAGDNYIKKSEKDQNKNIGNNNINLNSNLSTFEEMKYELNERGDKINQIQDKALQLGENSNRFLRAATKVKNSEKNGEDCIIF